MTRKKFSKEERRPRRLAEEKGRFYRDRYLREQVNMLNPKSSERSFGNFLRKEFGKLRSVESLMSWSAWGFWRTRKFVKWGEVTSFKALYRGWKMSGNYLAQNSTSQINRWIRASPLDLGNKAPPGAFNGALWTSKRQ